jgi:hypothetical protein
VAAIQLSPEDAKRYAKIPVSMHHDGSGYYSFPVSGSGSICPAHPSASIQTSIQNPIHHMYIVSCACPAVFITDKPSAKRKRSRQVRPAPSWISLLHRGPKNSHRPRSGRLLRGQRTGYVT